MASIVIIKEALDSVTADPQGRAAHIFTVTNQVGRRQSVGMQVLTDGGADPGWFHIEGGIERDFDAGSSHQVKVSFQAPAGIEPGRHTFRLLVYSTAKGRADEDFTEGPTVGVTVPELDLTPEPEPEPPAKKFPWWIVAVAVAVLLVIGLTWLLWPSGMEEGVRRPGGDLRVLEIEAAKASPGACQAACKDEAKCVAWTYGKPGLNGANASCSLKSSVTTPVAQDGYTSGVK